MLQIVEKSAVRCLSDTQPPKHFDGNIIAPVGLMVQEMSVLRSVYVEKVCVLAMREVWRSINTSRQVYNLHRNS